MVLITDGKGTIADMVPRPEAGDNIETFAGLLTPGFINVHCHLELSHLKGVIPEKTGLVEFVQQVMAKRAGYATASKKEIADLWMVRQQAMQDAESELFGSGTVAVGDICNTGDSLPIKENAKLGFHNFIEVSGFVDATAEKRLADLQNVYDRFAAIAGVNTTYSPHAPYSVSKTLFGLLNAKTGGQLISIHNQESAEENELYRQKSGGFLSLFKNVGIDISSFKQSGKTSFETWAPYFTNDQTVISVHNTFITPQDIELIKQPQALNFFFCLCINANKYIEQKLPPIALLRKNNCSLLVGTDSYASNRQLNMLEEIKTIQRETNYEIPLAEVLQWATINGAKALQMDNYLGSFERGKKPGVVLISGLNDLDTGPSSQARRIL